MEAPVIRPLLICELLAGIGLMTALALPSLATDVVVKLAPGDSFVVKNDADTIERLNVEEATGNISRNGALFVHTTGGRSSFVGVGAGNLASTANDNSAFGDGALNSATSGSYNSAFGTLALTTNTSGLLNSAFGRKALTANNIGTSNSAFGANALSSNTVGSENSAFGGASLGYNTSGSYNSAFGYAALYYNVDGAGNAAFGHSALYYNSNGVGNSSFGASSLFYNSSGGNNSALGYRALYYNYDGNRNSAFGEEALLSNSGGDDNAAFGSGALTNNITGSDNVALGTSALRFTTTGSDNIAVGRSAGSNQDTGNNNIYLANDGVASESGQIKIGTVGTHSQATIAGIHNNTSATGIAVLVNADGVLGTMTSSARFKQDVEDMGEASQPLMALRPVVFRYRDAVAAGEDVSEYGLIAEEVAQVFPALAAPGADGKPYSVRYHVLAPLLLNELQKQATLNQTQASEITALLGRVAELESRGHAEPSEASRE